MAEAEKGFNATHNEYVTVERHALQDNIILCDSKCGILLGFGALILLWCMDKLLALTERSEGYQRILEEVLYGCAIVALLIAVTFAWRVIKPRIHHSHDHIYWGSKIFKQSADDFALTVQNADSDRLTVDMLNHLHILAKICCQKYENFARAVMAMQFAGGFVILAVCVQIGKNFIAPR